MNDHKRYWEPSWNTFDKMKKERDDLQSENAALRSMLERMAIDLGCIAEGMLYSKSALHDPKQQVKDLMRRAKGSLTEYRKWKESQK